MANAPRRSEEWWISITEPETGDGTNTCRMIHTVPELFRQKESCYGCFDPMVVSIGPYHHGNSKLREVEKIKDKMVRQFIRDCGRELSDIRTVVEGIYAVARRYYPDEERVSRFNREQFIILMFVDGCFVLQFINSFMKDDHKVEHMKSNIAALVRRDLMLLENQLPYIVLETLMRLRFEGNPGNELINNFIRSFRGDLSPQTTRTQATFKFFDEVFDKFCSACKSPLNICGGDLIEILQQESPANNMRPLHLLDSFLTKYIDRGNLGREYPGGTHRHWYSYPTAKGLRTLGIHFKRSAGEHFTDIDFKSTLIAGWLFLPQIMIDDMTKSLLLNLVAYEASPDAPDDRCGLASYICFMDSLIDEAEDVKVLRSNGIVFNLLGSDQQAAELFNSLGQDLAPKNYAFCGTRQRIDSHSKSIIRTWMAEWIHTHFSSPWTLIAFIAVTATIVMTFLQAFFTVKGYYSGKGR